MFCPKCGQQQLSDEVRFCSRCGFQLEPVVKLLLTDGAISTGSFETKERKSLIRRKEMSPGAKVIFLSLVLFVPFFALSILFDSPGPLVVPALIFLVGLVQILYFLIFGENILPQRKKELALKETSQQQYLPPDRYSASVFDSKSATTNDLVSPFGVTERTTNLLDESEPEKH